MVHGSWLRPPKGATRGGPETRANTGPPHRSAHVLRQTALLARHSNTASEYMMAAPDPQRTQYNLHSAFVL
jgi:hypothetical protein